MTQPWETVRSTFSSLAESSVDPEFASSLQSMLALIEAIKSSQFAYGLHPWVSMFTLCIAQTEVEYPYSGPYLAITPLKGNRLDFRFIDTPDDAKQWHRITEGRNGFQQLESFLDHLHWFNHAG